LDVGCRFQRMDRVVETLTIFFLVNTLQTEPVLDDLDDIYDDDEHDDTAISPGEKIKITTREKAAVALELKHRPSIFSSPLDVTATLEPKIFPKTDEDTAFLHATMKDHLLFEELSDEEMTILIDATEKVTVHPGETIVRGNGFGEFLYVVQEGSLDVYCGCEKTTKNAICTLSRGHIFGETGLLYGRTCSATVQNNTTPSTLWRVDQQTFRLVLAQYAHAKDEDILTCLSKVELFSGMAPMQFQKFASCVSRVPFSQGDRILTKGETGEIFYIIETGSVRVHDIGIGDSQAADQILNKGDSFGEGALLTGEPRVASITALTDVVCFAMDRETFQQNIGDLRELVEFRGKLQSLQSLPIFSNSNLTPAELERLAELTVELCLRKGAKLCENGKPYPLKVWFIRSGQVLVYGGKTGKIFNLQSGDYFGEKSILGDPNRVSSHQATCEEQVHAWVLSREAIESVIADLNRLGESEAYVKTRLQKTIRSLKDLTMHRILGHGGFGNVFLVQSKLQSNNNVYALKVINKRKLLESKQERSVLREKELLQLLRHPFILYLVSSFQDATNLYLVLPLIQGGELFNLVEDQARKTGSGLKNNDAAFYAAGIIEALGHFHHRHMAYRDLKLENVMIDVDGYTKIVDLGFAKVIVDKSYTFCGTPEYLAPEIIMAKGHNHAVDYWSFGVLLYELLAGRSPFNKPGIQQMDMFKNIVFVDYKMLDHFNEQAQDLIRRLFVRAKVRRLGMLSRGHYDVQEHPWFAASGINDYKKLVKKELTPPWLPDVKDPMDASNFGEMKDVDIHKNEWSLSKEEQAVFAGF
jgi:protein kinase A